MLPLLAFLPVVVSAASLDVTDKDALGTASHQVAANLIKLFQESTGGDGAFNQASNSWFVSGEMWGGIFDHSRWTGDKSFDTIAATALGNASYNEQQDLLGGDMRTFNEKTLGKWNDDISWWALSMMAGVEIYGNDAVMPGSGKFITVAATTWAENLEQWDNQCGGGIYWSRDRTDSGRKNYKNTITNGEFMALGARLAYMTRNMTYLDWSVKAYDWMKNVGMITSDYHVYDGAQAPNCGADTLVKTEWTYSYGVIIQALVYMHRTTPTASYLSDAAQFAKVAIAKFASNGGIGDLCEASGNCGRDPPTFKAQLVKGLAYLYNVIDDADVKTSIQGSIDASMTNLVKNCDANWWCPLEWTGGATGMNSPYGQYTTLELMNAVAAVHGVKINNTSPGLVPVKAASNSGTSYWNGFSVPSGVAAMVVSYFVFQRL